MQFRARFLVLLLLGLALAGCGGGSSPVGDNDDAPALETVSAIYTMDQGATLATSSGHQVTVPPGSLSENGLVELRVLGAPPASPRDPDFQAQGAFLELRHDADAMTGPIRFRLQAPGSEPEEDFLALHVDGLFVPLETQVSDGGVLSGTLEAPPVATQSLTVGALDASGYFSRPAHQDWPSYNLYVFANGAFTRVVDQGVVVGTLPTLGAKPLMVVHGLGSSIRAQGFDTLAAQLIQQNGYTSVIGFEYDTLNDISANGQFLHQAYVQMNALAPGLAWHHVAHSMGSLVSRYNWEKTGALPVAATGNVLVTACGPHAGSTVIEAIQDHPNILQRFMLYLILNDEMDFANADGRPCKVTGLEPGFTDLRIGSAFLNGLNPGAAGNHPQVNYRTVGGNYRGVKYDMLDFIAYGIHTSKYLDDGLVDLESANPSAGNPAPYTLDIGAQAQAVVDENHSTAVTDPPSITVLGNLLAQ